MKKNWHVSATGAVLSGVTGLSVMRDGFTANGWLLVAISAIFAVIVVINYAQQANRTA